MIKQIKQKLWITFKPCEIKPGDAFSDILVLSKEEEVEELFSLVIKQDAPYIQIHLPGGMLTVPYNDFVESLVKVREALKNPSLRAFPTDLSLEMLWDMKVGSIKRIEREEGKTEVGEAPEKEGIDETKTEAEREEAETQREAYEKEQGKEASPEKEESPGAGSESESIEKTETKEEQPTLREIILGFASQVKRFRVEELYALHPEKGKSSLRGAISKLAADGLLKRVGKGEYEYVCE